MKRALEEPRPDPNCLSIGVIPPDVWQRDILPKSLATTLFVFRFVNKGAHAVVNRYLTEELHKEMHDPSCQAYDLALFGSVPLYDWFTEIAHQNKIAWNWGHFLEAAVNGHLDLVKHTHADMVTQRKFDHIRGKISHYITMMGGYTIEHSCREFKRVIEGGNLELIQKIAPFFTSQSFPTYQHFITAHMGTKFMANITDSVIKSDNMDVIKFICSQRTETDPSEMLNSIFMHSKSVKSLETILNMFGYPLDTDDESLKSSTKNPNIDILTWTLNHLKVEVDPNFFAIHEIAEAAASIPNVDKIILIFNFITCQLPGNVISIDFYRECIHHTIYYGNSIGLNWLILNGPSLTGLSHDALRGNSFWGGAAFQAINARHTEHKMKILYVLYEHKFLEATAIKQQIKLMLVSFSNMLNDLKLFKELMTCTEIISTIIVGDRSFLLRKVIDDCVTQNHQEFARHWLSYANDYKSLKCMELLTEISNKS